MDDDAPGDVKRTSDAGRVSGYSQTRPMRVQLEHSGSVSGHLTFLRLQLKQPRRDLVWPFRGIGLRRTRMLRSVPDEDGVVAADAGPGSGELLPGSAFWLLMVHLAPLVMLCQASPSEQKQPRLSECCGREVSCRGVEDVESVS
jgi:hypothetical protein